jgi:tRNA G18 (ribose-2'-O)-methylase SpoU
MRGFFEIGVYAPKSDMNIGTLWRSAYQLGASGIFTIGRRYKRQPSDTVNACLHVPLRNFATWDDFEKSLPYGAPLVAVEMGGRNLAGYGHPARAIYLLGAEDHGLPPRILARCHSVVSIESERAPSFNVAVAGSIVMWDRYAKNGGSAPGKVGAR